MKMTVNEAKKLRCLRSVVFAYLLTITYNSKEIEHYVSNIIISTLKFVLYVI